MAKYLIFKPNKDEPESPIIFEDYLGHDEMKKILQSKFKNLEVVSAGFVQITLKGEFKITGKGSVSLNIDSREIDNMILNIRLNR